MTDQADPPIRIRARRTLSERRFKLETVTVEQAAADGSTETLHREVYHSGAGAAVLPIDRGRGRVLLVRQPRVPVLVNGDGAALGEACAGMIDGGESPLDTVRREAEEELGTRLRALRPVFGPLYTSPGACTERLHLFVAEYGPDDRFGAGGGLPDEGERITVLEPTLAEAWEMVATGRIRDAKTVLLLQQARLEQNTWV